MTASDGGKGNYRFPVFAQARAKARQATCLTHMKQMGLAFTMYAQDYDEVHAPLFVWVSDTYGLAPPDAHGIIWYAPSYRYEWMQALQPYVKNYRIFVCPDSPGQDPAGTILNLNYAGNRQAFSVLATPGTTVSTRTVTMAQVTRPADTLAIVEFGVPAAEWDRNVRVGQYSGKNYLPNDPRGCGAADPKFCPNDRRHNGKGINITFFDGHAKWMNTSALIQDGNLWCINGINPANQNRCNP